jgi:redox-sensitive bicupin YhaK (pirin superfamily)
MKIIVHKASSRGFADHGWLKSNHTFSFANYYNPERIRFGTLRVLNDDIIEGRSGFGEHPHDNMEIISIPVYGALEHKDSMGNKKVIHDNEVQVMSAGRGVYHSEYNHYPDRDANFLQVWILPKKKDIEPRYDQRALDEKEFKNKLKLVISPDQQDATLGINQDAYISMGEFEKESKAVYNVHMKENGLYIFIIEGKIEIEGETYERRDGIGITDFENVEINFLDDTKIVLFEVPMT